MIHYAEDCDCWNEDIPKHPDFVPEDFADLMDAVPKFKEWILKEKIAGHYLYWAVHFNGQHILSVSSS